MASNSDDGAMILDEDQWPAWPRLPVKRRNAKGWSDCALIVAGAPLTVIQANMFATREELVAAPVTVYTSMAALLADGWVVD